MNEYGSADTSALIPYINNSRTHSDEQIAQVSASIKEFGFTNPILIDEDNGIIAGHGRLLAARKLGLDTVPTITLKGLTDAQKKAYVIADNQLALNAGWDLDALKLELETLQELDFDIDLLGFEDDFIDGLLEPEPSEGLTDEDECPEPPETPVSVLGDIWQLGNHRLMCGSSTEPDDVDTLMDGCYPKLIHTDPPYGMNAVSRSAVLTKSYGNDIMGDDDPQVAKDAFTLINSLYPEAKQIWWGANYYCSVLPDSECWLVWDKNNGQSDQTDCELAWANFRSVVRQFTQASEKTNRVHPTQKPVSLVEWIFKRFKYDCSTIADYFGGSGSTLIAAEKHNAAAYVMEFDPKFTDVIINRWQDFTGKEAIHIESGKTYKELAISKNIDIDSEVA
jgi:DNA modification methylase